MIKPSTTNSSTTTIAPTGQNMRSPEQRHGTTAGARGICGPKFHIPHSTFHSLLPALSLALTSTGCAHKTVEADSTPAAMPTVQVATARTGTIEKTFPLTATISPLPNMEATVSPSVSGIVDSLPVRLGQTVDRGQLVGHLSTVALSGQIDQARATIAQNQIQVRQAQIGEIQQRAQSQATIEQAASAVANARATLASDKATLEGNLAALRTAQEKLTRQRALYKDGLGAGKDVEDAQLAVSTAQAQVDAQRQTVDAQKETVNGQVHALQAAKTARLQDTIKRADVDVARAQVANAQGALRTAQTQLGLYTLHAPVTGQVVAVGANLGENVDTSTKLVTIVNLDTVQVQLPIPAESASTVHPGQTVKLTTDNLPGRTFTTQVRTVGRQVDTATGTLTAYCTIANLNHALQDDQTVKASIVIDRTTGIAVPTTAVLRDPGTGTTTVDVVDAGGVLHVKPVKIGLAAGGQAQIISGITTGDQIATSGQYGIPDGAKVTVTHAP